MNHLKKVCENKNFCSVEMPSENLEYFIERIDGYENNPENSSTKNVGEHIPSDFSMFIISLFTSVRMNMM